MFNFCLLCFMLAIAVLILPIGLIFAIAAWRETFRRSRRRETHIGRGSISVDRGDGVFRPLGEVEDFTIRRGGEA